jgi:hypothetical protein
MSLLPAASTQKDYQNIESSAKSNSEQKDWYYSPYQEFCYYDFMGMGYLYEKDFDQTHYQEYSARFEYEAAEILNSERVYLVSANQASSTELDWNNNSRILYFENFEFGIAEEEVFDQSYYYEYEEYEEHDTSIDYGYLEDMNDMY